MIKTISALLVTLAAQQALATHGPIVSGEDSIPYVALTCRNVGGDTVLSVHAQPTFAAVPHTEYRWLRMETVVPGDGSALVDFTNPEESPAFLLDQRLPMGTRRVSLRVLINHSDDPAIYASFPARGLPEAPAYLNLDLNRICREEGNGATYDLIALDQCLQDGDGEACYRGARL